MINISRLYCDEITPGDWLHYGRGVPTRPETLGDPRQGSGTRPGECVPETASQRKPIVVWNITRACHQAGRVRLIGETRVMRQVFETIRQVAPTRSNVLITGESGTGDEIGHMPMGCQVKTGSSGPCVLAVVGDPLS